MSEHALAWIAANKAAADLPGCRGLSWNARAALVVTSSSLPLIVTPSPPLLLSTASTRRASLATADMGDVIKASVAAEWKEMDAEAKAEYAAISASEKEMYAETKAEHAEISASEKKMDAEAKAEYAEISTSEKARLAENPELLSEGAQMLP
jgi:hypothetical protein